VSGQDAMFMLLDNWPTLHAAGGLLPERIGNRHLATAPYDCYRARDGWVAIAVASNKLFRTLAAAIGRPELGEGSPLRCGRAGTPASAASGGAPSEAWRSTASWERGSRRRVSTR